MNIKFCAWIFVLTGLVLTAAVFAQENVTSTEVAAPDAVLQEERLARLPAELTVGFQTRESETEGIGDLLIPVWSSGGKGLLFVNPRTAMTDHDGKEVNIGMGFRHLLLNEKLILGANLYYDYRDTGYSHYDQWGAGLELLSDWVDARFNYYDPESKLFTVNRQVETEVSETLETTFRWGDPYGRGNLIMQDYLTTRKQTTTVSERTFEQYEQALGGYDWEVGVKLPYLPDALETRLFGGYYHFERDFGADAKGWKARAELRLRSTLFLDAGVYENADLTGSEWFVGARLNVPFELDAIASGRNPFASAPDRWQQGSRPLPARLTEMVMRDPQIQLEMSGLLENKSRFKQESTVDEESQRRRVTVLADVNFVDGDARMPGDGSAERPFARIQEGVDNAFGRANIYVYNASGAYLENVELAEGTHLWGSGYLIPVSGSRAFGSGIAPVVDGMSQGPSVTMANQTSLRGFSIRNTDAGGPAQPVTIGSMAPFDVSRVGIFGNDAAELTIENNRITGNADGVLVVRQGDLNLAFNRNIVRENSVSGLRVEGTGSSGLFNVLVDNSTFSGNAGGGVQIHAAQYDEALTLLRNSRFSGNGLQGAHVSHVDTFFSLVLADGVQADGNSGSGLAVSQAGNLISLVNLSSASVNRNAGHGLSLEQESDMLSGGVIGMPAGFDSLVSGIADLAGFGLPDEVMDALSVSGPVTAVGNQGDGVYADISADTFALGAVFDVTANENQVNGVNAWVSSDDGVAVGLAGSSENLAQILQLGTDVAGFFGLDLPLSLPGEGRMQAHDNQGSGFNLDVQGDFAGVAVVAGVESTGNAGWGSRISSTGGMIGLSAASRIDSTGNAGANIEIAAMSPTIAAGILADVNASGSLAGDGILAEIDGGDTGLLLTLSTDALRPLAALLGEEFLGEPYDLPGEPFGPVRASGNAGRGINASVSGSSLAGAIFMDTHANDNGAAGYDVSVTSDDGIAFGAILSSELLYTILPDLVGMPPVEDAGLGMISVLGNQGDGILLDVNGEYDALALLGGVDASQNSDGNGIDLTLNSGDGSALAMLADVYADENSERGIGLNIDAADDVLVGLVNVWTDDNATRGIQLNAQSVFDDVVVLLANANARGNGGTGFYADLTALNGDTALALTDTAMSYNGNRGANVLMTAGDDAYLFAGDTAGFDLDDVFNFGDDFGGLMDFIPSGRARFNDNDGGGLRADMTSIDGDAIVLINDAQASYNGNMGFNLMLEAVDGDINTLIQDSESSWNGGNGIRVLAEGGGGTTAVALDSVATVNNDSNGIFLDTEYNGNIALQGQRLTSAGNADNGVRVVVSGVVPSLFIDFGGGTLGSPGLNSFYNNGNRDFRYNNGGGATVAAQQSWWGAVPPVGGQVAGDVDFSNWLLADPNTP